MPLQRLTACTVVADHEKVPRRELMRTEFYNDFMRRFGMYGSATAVLANDPEHVAALGIIRDKRDLYQKRELQLLKVLLPHLVRATEMNRKLKRITAERDGLMTTIDLLDVACNLSRPARASKAHEPTGQSLTRSADGFSVIKRRLKAVLVEDDARLNPDHASGLNNALLAVA